LAIDREDTLKKAEKFLRQGRLDQAIAEYERVVDDQPRDWTTANALGDLYLRANKPDRAVVLYQRIADHLFTEGFYPKASALYKKILKIAPDNERVQLNLAEIATKQGLLAEAKSHYMAVAKRRRDRGDTAGADEITIRLGMLDPADVEARLIAARTIEGRGDAAQAAAKFREIYDFLIEKGREKEALGALREAVRLDPSDAASRATLAKAAVEKGDYEQAREFLDREVAGSDPSLLLALINVELHTGRIEVAQEMLPDLFALDPQLRYAIVELAWTLIESNIFAASTCVDSAVNALIAHGEFAEAASILQEFAARVPGQVNALLKLVEVCVDGGLEATMYEAQAQLADAYLAIGLAGEARVIAEDLLSREPWESAHVDRLRKALTMLKVPDVEAAIKERLNAPPDEHISPVVRDEAEASPAPPVKPVPAVPPPVAPEPPRAAAPPPPPKPAPPPPPVAKAPEKPAPEKKRTAEVDLTTLLGDLQGGAPAPTPLPLTPPPQQELGQVFAGLRAKADRNEDDNEAGEHLALAKTYIEMGLGNEAISSLEVAARSPRHRFEAAGLLARIYRDQGDLPHAIEWFERAAEAPSPSPDGGRELLYDLGLALQASGELERALAVFLELDADAQNYRDVSSRVAQLSRQTGG
jgi:tetratricopeptide (TPR) repeat protein